MNIKKWLYLFSTTLLVGGVSSVLLGMILEQGTLWGQGWTNILMGLVWNFGLGLLFSVVAQMGFFAYLTIHNVGIGFFRSFWPYIQILLIAYTFFDMVYFRFTTFAQEGESFLGYIGIPLGILLYAIVVSYFKVKETNKNAAIPTVFALFVVTIIEWIPALKENNLTGMFYMLIPLLLCNTWQIMLLHRLTKKSPVAEAAALPNTKATPKKKTKSN